MLGRNFVEVGRSPSRLDIHVGDGYAVCTTILIIFRHLEELSVRLAICFAWLEIIRLVLAVISVYSISRMTICSPRHAIIAPYVDDNVEAELVSVVLGLILVDAMWTS